MIDFDSGKFHLKEESTPSKTLWFAPVLLSGIFLIVLMGLLWLLQQQSFNLYREELQENSRMVVSRIDMCLSGDREFLELLVEDFVRDALDEISFRKRANRYVKNHDSLINIAWADKEHIIRWTSPYEANKQIIGLKLNLTEPKRASREAKETKQPIYTRPFQVIQGQPAFEVYVPVYRENQFLGCFIGVYSIKNLLQNLVPLSLQKSHHASFTGPTGEIILQLPALKLIDRKLVRKSALIPPGYGSALVLSRYSGGTWAFGAWALIFLSICLAIGMAWGMFILRKDIRTRILYENALRAREKEAQRLVEELSQSNEELEEFAYVASHDLQEPLHKVHAFSELLIDKYAHKLDETGRDYLRRMNSASNRMQEMIENLLTLSRITTKAKPIIEVKLEDIIHEVVSDLEIKVKRYKAVIKIEELPVLEADPSQMHQLFANLMNNSLKYHRQGIPPEIHIYTKEAGNEKKKHQREGFCTIYVADNGQGFEEKYAQRMFQSFEQLHPRGQYDGLGMGLAICKKIVRRHGGTITASSSGDSSAVFTLQLPLYIPPTGGYKK
jgi:signal transduction histidine kinase